MDSNSPALDPQRYPALARSFRRAKKLGTSEIRERMWREAAIPPPPAPDPARSHAALEGLTAGFRAELARKHRSSVRDARLTMRELQDMWCPVGDLATAAAVREERDLLGAPPSDLNPNLYAFSSAAVTKDGEILEGPAATREWVDQMWAAARKATWHDGRDRGQQKRFDTVRSCGSRVIIAQCAICEHKREPIPEGCGVSRVCARCSLQKAKARRARFGRARGRAILAAVRKGLTRKVRTNGRFSEKMLTVTIPHVMHADCKGSALERGKDDVSARVEALYLAWPIFLRKLNYFLSGKSEQAKADALRKLAELRGGGFTRAGARLLKRAGKLDRVAGQRRMDRPHVVYHRAFEWTPGDDGKGHPHFHVYVHCTYLPGERVHAWWASACRAAGLTIGKVRCTKTTKTMRAGEMVDAVVSELRMLRGFNEHAVRELMKGGKRSALELSRVSFEHGSELVETPVGLSGAVFRRGPGLDAYVYAEGFTIAEALEFCTPEIVASLYMPLEAKRLSQASRGFFTADPPCECTNCGAAGGFVVSFKSAAELERTHPLAQVCAHDLDHLVEKPP